MKPSEALRLVRIALHWKTDGGFICHMLAAIGTPGAYKAAVHIGNLLAPHATYGAWLEYNHPGLYKKYVRTPIAHLEARLCWIDDMIDYWESKGE